MNKVLATNSNNRLRKGGSQFGPYLPKSRKLPKLAALADGNIL